MTRDPFDSEERRSLIVPPEHDVAGRIITPAIDFGTGFMPNGQPIVSFYRRGERNWKDAEWHALLAVARAAERLLDLDEQQ